MNIKEYISSGIIEHYVLGLTSQEENKEVEAMAKDHPDIQAAIESCHHTLEAYGQLHAVQPPGGVKARIMEAIHNEHKIESSPAPPAAIIEKEPAIIRNLHKWRRIAAAAIILLIASLALNGLYIGKYKQYRGLYQEMARNQQQLFTQNKIIEARLAEVKNNLQVLLNPAMKPVIMEGVNKHPGMVATVYWDPQSRHAYLGSANLPNPPSGKAYQLWAIVDGKPVSMGMYNPAKQQIPLAMKNVIPGKVQAFAVTLEKQGGSLKPTMDQMYVMGKI